MNRFRISNYYEIKLKEICHIRIGKNMKNKIELSLVKKSAKNTLSVELSYLKKFNFRKFGGE